MPASVATAVEAAGLTAAYHAISKGIEPLVLERVGQLVSGEDRRDDGRKVVTIVVPKGELTFHQFNTQFLQGICFAVVAYQTAAGMSFSHQVPDKVRSDKSCCAGY